MVIYKITNKINSKTYIGQTTRDLAQRWKEHCRDFSQRKLYRAIQKYGVENFKAEIIQNCSSLSELNNQEVFWINKHNSIRNGYNIRHGGNNSKNSAETREKLSKKLLAKHCKPFRVYLAILIKNNGKKGKKYKKGSLIGMWENKSVCAKDLGIQAQSISSCLNKNNKTYRGYVFEYVGDNIDNFLSRKYELSTKTNNKKNISEANLKKNKRKFEVYKAICVQKASPGKKAVYKQGKLVGVWSNKVTCADNLNISRHFAKSLNNPSTYPQMYGYIYRYTEALIFN
jgi:hypothetical protein